MVRCFDWSLYTGISTDPSRREREHNTGRRGARYTRSRRPVSLVYLDGPFTKQVALQWERKIKGMTRPEKEALFTSPIPALTNGP